MTAGLADCFDFVHGVDNLHGHSKGETGRRLMQRISCPPAHILLPLKHAKCAKAGPQGIPGRHRWRRAPGDLRRIVGGAPREARAAVFQQYSPPYADAVRVYKYKGTLTLRFSSCNEFFQQVVNSVILDD